MSPQYKTPVFTGKSLTWHHGILTELGWRKIGANEEWRACYWHDENKLLLMVYADDL